MKYDELRKGYKDDNGNFIPLEHIYEQDLRHTKWKLEFISNNPKAKHFPIPLLDISED